MGLGISVVWLVLLQPRGQWYPLIVFRATAFTAFAAILLVWALWWPAMVDTVVEQARWFWAPPADSDRFLRAVAVVYLLAPVDTLDFQPAHWPPLPAFLVPPVVLLALEGVRPVFIPRYLFLSSLAFGEQEGG